MRKITAILQPDPDGSLHLPIPDDLRGSRIKVVATLDAVASEAKTNSIAAGFGSLKGKIWMAPDFDEPLKDFEEYIK